MYLLKMICTHLLGFIQYMETSIFVGHELLIEFHRITTLEYGVIKIATLNLLLGVNVQGLSE